MTEDRKPRNISPDPELWDALQKWCRDQDVKVPVSRAIDVAIKEFLEARKGQDQ